MANNTQEQKTFKYGDREYLIDDLLKLHAQQENNYYNFARDKGRYDEAAIAGLRNAITNRINSIKNGEAFEGDGTMSTDQPDNTKILTKKRILQRKNEYTNQDNTEWAKYYVNKLIEQLDSQNPKGAWDPSKYGLEAYLSGMGLNAKDIFEKYDLPQTDDPTEARKYDQRRSLLFNQLNNYKAWLQNKQFDFTKNDNEWDDSTLEDLDKLITNFDSYDENAISTFLRKLGAGDLYTTAFTSDKWDLSKTNKQISEASKKAAEEKKAKEEQEAYTKYMENLYNAYDALSDNNRGGSYFTTKGDGMFLMSDNEFNKWAETHTGDKDYYMNYLADKFYANPFDLEVAGEYLPLVGYFGGLKDVNIDGRTWSYDPRTIDRKNNRLVIFDKETGEMKHTFLGDIDEELKRMKREWRLKNGYEKASDKYTTYNEQGGVLSMQTGGGFNLAQAVNRKLEEQNKARAEETGNSEEVQKARDRVVSNGDDSFVSEKASIAQPDAGFSGAEIARLISIGADITSMFLDPVTGTAVGLGSTLLNFGSDIADDGFQWEDVKNLGINVGFDLLGAIPLFGDALGTGTKITRQLLKWAPRAMGLLAGYQGVENFDGMMESWGKLTSGDKDKKLTVQDWRNIAQSIGLITGGTRAIKNKAAQANMKKQAKVDGVVGVNVRDKNTGEIKQLLIDGETAKNIRNHKGDKTKIENELDQLETLKGKFGEKGDFEVVTKGGKWQRPIGRSENADGSKSWELRGFRGEGRADVRDVYDFNRIQQGPHSIGYQIPVVSQWLNNKHQMLMNRLNPGLNQQSYVGAKTSKQIDDEIAKLRQDQNGKAGVDTEIANVKAAMAARGKAQKSVTNKLAPARKKLKDLQKKLNGVADEATLTGTKTKLESDLVALDTQIQQRQNLLNAAQSDLQKLLNKKRIPKTQQKAHADAIKRARGRIQGHQAILNGYNTKKQQLTSDLNQTNTHLRNWGELAPTQANVKRLNDINSRLSQKNHTNAYNRLQQILSDLQINHSNIGGRQINWDMQEILKQAGIQNAFKQGGSINRNKINKFLNYGKR